VSIGIHWTRLLSAIIFDERTKYSSISKSLVGVIVIVGDRSNALFLGDAMGAIAVESDISEGFSKVQVTLGWK
jgi:hypothetical protein